MPTTTGAGEPSASAHSPPQPIAIIAPIGRRVARPVLSAISPTARRDSRASTLPPASRIPAVPVAIPASWIAVGTRNDPIECGAKLARPAASESWATQRDPMRRAPRSSGGGGSGPVAGPRPESSTSATTAIAAPNTNT